MRWLKRLADIAFLVAMVLGALVLAVHTRKVVPYPEEPVVTENMARAKGQWVPHGPGGINQVVLTGNAFERGRSYGVFTAALLEKQEDALMEKFRAFFPYTFLQQSFILLAKAWFTGIEKYIDEDWRREMHGVALSAPVKYDSVADPYLRQLGYHGLHEVGQLFVDYGEDGFGCTVLAVPGKQGWLVGRNFDFEGGRIFDEEKIMKWVFPDEGLPFVSVTWAGMVGAVTGVNAKGVFLSLNAAGSRDFSRLGTPTSLILLKALQHAESAAAAVEILQEGKSVITEIFSVADRDSFYVVEKSPARFEARKAAGPIAVANHLTGTSWAGDATNEFRRTELTSAARLARASELVQLIGDAASPQRMAEALRDKQVGGKARLGHRSAIDAQIATHSVIYDAGAGILYVNVGPSVAGSFQAFPLAQVFASKSAVAKGSLPGDPTLNAAQYSALHADLEEYARVLVPKTPVPCEQKAELLKNLESRAVHYLKYLAQAKVEERCGGNSRPFLKAALAEEPAYARERKAIADKLASTH